MLNKKRVTFFIVSGEKGGTKRISISTSLLKLLGGLAFVLAVILSTGLVDYVGIFVDSVENKRLQAENVQLKEQFKEVEGKLTALENNLNRVKRFYTKLKLIIPSQDRSESQLRLAMGPLPKVGHGFESYHSDVNQRVPSSELENKDLNFYKQAPLGEGRGELAVEDSRNYASLVIRMDRAFEQSSLQEQGLLKLWGQLSERQSLLNSTPSIKPVFGWMTSGFGYRISPFTGAPTMHNGVDIAAAPGTPIKSPASGVVSYVGYDEGYGKLVAIDHGYGVVTRYGHNSKVYVTVGQRVERFDTIAAVGNTGRSTGPHLHYEVRMDGVPVDPSNYILGD